MKKKLENIFNQIKIIALKGMGFLMKKESSSLRTILENHADNHREFSASEKNMLTNIIGFGESRVEDSMVPRADIVAVDINTSPDEVIKLLLLFGANPHLENTLGKNSIDIARRYKNDKWEKVFNKTVNEIIDKCNDKSVVEHLQSVFKLQKGGDMEKSKREICNCISFLRRDGKDDEQIPYEDCTEMIEKLRSEVFTFKDHDEDETHCIFRHQIPEISVTEKNPLTGKKIPSHVLKRWYKEYDDSCDIEELKKRINKEIN